MKECYILDSSVKRKGLQETAILKRASQKTPSSCCCMCQTVHNKHEKKNPVGGVLLWLAKDAQKQLSLHSRKLRED